MKKWIVLSVFMVALPFSMMAQDDDLYFNPKQEAKKVAEERAKRTQQLAEQRARRDSIYALYWSGSDRNVDEYNRGGKLFSQYQNIGSDSLGNDIISFRIDKGVAPDTICDDEAFAEKYTRDMRDDFDCTRCMSRWDGFYDPWFYDYYGCGSYYWRSSYWRWHNPWRYGYYAGWYDPWFDPWYDPWYYGYAGWYGRPWYGWGGYYPWYWGGPVVTYVCPSNGYRSYGHVASGSSSNRGFHSSQFNRFGRRESNNSNRNYNNNYNYNNNHTFNSSGFGNRSVGSGSFGGGTRGGGFGGGGSRSHGSGRR